MKLTGLRDVFVETVRDLYHAEKQLLKALPRMAKGATHPDLKAAFTEHLELTRGQAERLERICETLGVKAGGKTCAGMKGLIEEGAEVIAAEGVPTAKDAALICAAQKIEHYEIAGYGCAHTFARLLGETEAAELLEESLEEEKTADEKLSEVAENGLNEDAGDEEEEEGGEAEEAAVAPKPKPKAKPKAKPATAAAKPARKR